MTRTRTRNRMASVGSSSPLVTSGGKDNSKKKRNTFFTPESIRFQFVFELERPEEEQGGGAGDAGGGRPVSLGVGLEGAVAAVVGRRRRRRMQRRRRGDRLSRRPPVVGAGVAQIAVRDVGVVVIVFC